MPIYIFKINIFEIKVPSYHMQHISFFTSPVRHSFLIANSFPVLPIVIIDILEMRSIKQNHMIILLVFHKQPQLHLLQLCFHSFRPYSITVKNEGKCCNSKEHLMKGIRHINFGFFQGNVQHNEIWWQALNINISIKVTMQIILLCCCRLRLQENRNHVCNWLTSLSAMFRTG